MTNTNQPEPAIFAAMRTYRAPAYEELPDNKYVEHWCKDGSIKDGKFFYTLTSVSKHGSNEVRYNQCASFTPKDKSYYSMGINIDSLSRTIESVTLKIKHPNITHETEEERIVTVRGDTLEGILHMPDGSGMVYDGGPIGRATSPLDSTETNRIYNLGFEVFNELAKELEKMTGIPESNFTLKQYTS